MFAVLLKLEICNTESRCQMPADGSSAQAEYILLYIYFVIPFIRAAAEQYNRRAEHLASIKVNARTREDQARTRHNTIFHNALYK